MKRFAYILLIVFVTGCKTTKPIVSDTHESNLIEREQVDSLIRVAEDRARTQLALFCDSLGNIYITEINTLQGERTRLDIALRAALDELNSRPANDTQAKPKIFYLDADCKSDSLQLLVNKLRERIKHIESHKEKEVVVEEVVPAYYKRVSTGFWILLAILVVIIGWKIAKIYFKIQSGGLIK